MLTKNWNFAGTLAGNYRLMTIAPTAPGSADLCIFNSMREGSVAHLRVKQTVTYAPTNKNYNFAQSVRNVIFNDVVFALEFAASSAASELQLFNLIANNTENLQLTAVSVSAKLELAR